MKAPSFSLKFPLLKSGRGITLLALTIFLPVLIGLSIAIFGYFIGILWGALLAFIVTYIIVSNKSNDYSGLFFVIGFLLHFLLSLISKLTGMHLVGLWQLLLVFSIFGFAKFYAFIKESRIIRYGLWSFLGFLFLGFLCTVTSDRLNVFAAIYQFLSDLKPMLIVVLGFAIAWDEKTECWFWKFFDWYWLPAWTLIVFELALPDAYYTVFKPLVQLGGISAIGLTATRAVGPFMLSSYLAASGAMFAMMMLSRILTGGKAKKWDWFRLVAYVGIVIASIQRQELFSLIFALALIVVIAKPGRMFMRSFFAITVLMVGTIAFFIVFWDRLELELVQMGIGTIQGIENARVQIYQGAFQLANENFPLGTGLGTYGGAGADKFDHSLYQQLGFDRYWWFRQPHFLMDTYWPNSLAETGYLGMFLLFFSYIALLWHAFIRCVNTLGNVRMYWCFASAGILYLLMLSLTSPSFQDPMLSFLPLLTFAFAHKLEKRGVSKV